MSKASFFKFDKSTFEQELNAIAQSKGLRLRDVTHAKPSTEELLYDMTTINPQVRILFYSSLSPITGRARENGKDAIRVVLWAMGENRKPCYKKFKKHYRIETIFQNIDKTVDEINEWVQGDEAKRWLYMVGKNGKVKAEG